MRDRIGALGKLTVLARAVIEFPTALLVRADEVLE
jgi:hypothetical protein